MKNYLKSSLALLLFVISLPAAAAELYFFSYTVDGVTPWSPDADSNAEFTAIVDGSLQGDGDTIVINALLSASLSGIDYVIGDEVGIRGHVPGSPARISLSGETLDVWACVQGFSIETANGPDCPFGAEGGFLINNTAGDLGLVNFPGLSGNPDVEQTIFWSGIPELGASTREGDIPLNAANWTAVALDSDDDGTPDANDQCPVTILTSTVIVLGADSGVENYFFSASGCSTSDLVQDLVADCLQGERLMSCTARGLNNLKSIAVITGREKGRLQSTIARSQGGPGRKGKGRGKRR